MGRRQCSLVSLALAVGCARRPIQDGQQVGPLIQIKDVFTSCFLLEYDPGEFALFDACNRGSGASVTRTLDRLGHRISDVQHVFITHADTEHMGALGRLPNARLYAMRRDRDRIEAEGHRVRSSLTDGSEVQLGSHLIRAFSVPGHTAGNAAFEIDGVLLLGDAVLAMRDGSLEAPADRLSDDPDQNVASVRALAQQLADADAEITWLAPTDSGPIYGLDALVAF